jgi:hypothetical protein
MRILTYKKLFYSTLILSIFKANLFAQDTKTLVQQDPKFEQLLNEKRKINASITVNEHFKIQIYTGTSETSKKTLNGFKRDFKNYDGTIIFSTPSYKVWVGNFKTRIEAERNLILLKKKYPNAFLIKPNK